MKTLYDVIKSELIQQGHNEFKNSDGKLVFFDVKYQFIQKILRYDEDVSDIVDHLFNGISLTHREHDQHFKRLFISKFLNRRINRQTIESFKFQLMTCYMTNETLLNRYYSDMDKYVTGVQENSNTNEQTNKQNSDGQTTSDNRQAFANLPQNNVQLDVDNTVMTSASDNSISRNKQVNSQNSDGEVKGQSNSQSKQYHYDLLVKSSRVMENLLNDFDKACFMQVW